MSNRAVIVAGDARGPEISRKRPACLLFLIDQSASMSEPFVGTQYSKSDAVALTINETIYRLLANCAPDGDVWDYFHIGALGYGGDSVTIAFGGKLEGLVLATSSMIDASPRRMVTRSIEQDGETLTIKQPEWIVARAKGMTPMVQAIRKATEVVEEFCSDFPQSAPPIVLNLSDGEASDGEPVEAAAALTATGTELGRTRFFNLQLTATEVEPAKFPADPGPIKDKFARKLFDVSSELPAYMVSMAQKLGLDVAAGARGFCCNADMSTLVDFLEIGSMPGNVR